MMSDLLKTVGGGLALQPQSITTEVLMEKYAINSETSAEDVFRRVARAVASVEQPEDREKWENTFFENMMAGAIGAGRIMASAGAETNSTWVNCFVQPLSDTASGCDEDGVPGIYQALEKAGETLRRGGGVGFDFTPIRPRGALVKGTNSEASGPCVFMDTFDASCKSVMAAGNRRGAQMGVLKVSHPDILEFIKAKRTVGRWNNFNVSVGICDDFMEALKFTSSWELVHKAKPAPSVLAQGAYQREDGLWVYNVVQAQELWDTIMQSAFDFAEPGVLFLGTMNRDNNLRYCEKIDASNPCGEQPLPAYGCCDLGPIILPKFVRKPFSDDAFFDFDAFEKSVAIQVRFLDNVLDGTPWPLPEQETEAKSKRRIGVGFTGLGNALAMLGERYNSDAGTGIATRISECMRDAAYGASITLAQERGNFPLFVAADYLAEGTFASRLPDGIKRAIETHGIRNSHLLSIAPTGTVSLAFADNASNGIEPPFALAYQRKKRMPDGETKNYDVLDHGFRAYLSSLEQKDWPQEIVDGLKDAICLGQEPLGWDSELTVESILNDGNLVTALELTVDDHLAMMRAVQPYIDSAISKTVNVPADYSFEDFKSIYLRAYEYGLKGVATYRPNAILGSVLSVPSESKSASTEVPSVLAEADPLRVVLQSRPEGELDAKTEKMVYSNRLGEQTLYVSVSFAKVNGVVNGKSVRIERPIEVFIPAAQNNESVQWVSSTMRLLSMAARTGTLSRALKDLRQIVSNDGAIRYGWHTKDDGTKVPKYHDSEVAAIAYAIQQIIYRRGLFDVAGGEIPTRVLLEDYRESLPQTPANAPPIHEVYGVEVSTGMPAQAGKHCIECGAYAVVKRDGCEFCTSCNTVGTCG